MGKKAEKMKSLMLSLGKQKPKKQEKAKAPKEVGDKKPKKVKKKIVKK